MNWQETHCSLLSRKREGERRERENSRALQILKKRGQAYLVRADEILRQFTVCLLCRLYSDYNFSNYTWGNTSLCLYRTNTCKTIAGMINNGRSSTVSLLYDTNKWLEDCVLKTRMVSGTLLKTSRSRNDYMAIGLSTLCFEIDTTIVARSGNKNLCRARKIRKNSPMLKYETRGADGGNKSCGAIESEP